MSVPVHSFNMRAIEIFEAPEYCNIELEFRGGKCEQYRCRLDASYASTVTEIYNKDDQVIATSIEDLIEMGVTKARVLPVHEIELEGF